jgi:hypothetical protein
MVTEIELFEFTDVSPLELFVGLDEERSLQSKGGYTRRIARSHFGCCFPHKVNVKTN